MAAPTIKAKIPSSASKGDIIEIKTAIEHPMESGQRKGPDGNIIPRKIINKFVCKYAGKEVLSFDWFPAVAANPIMAFHLRATESGAIELNFIDDDGSVYTHKAEIKVS